jgi:hypothetical protein
MPYKYKSLGKRRFMAGSGVRFMKDGRVRCQAVCRRISKARRKVDPNFKTKDLWPEYQCKLAARKGYYVCGWHGAGREGGPGPGRIAGMAKKPTDFIKDDLKDKYRTFAEDPELFNMRHTASLMQARNAELLEDLSEGALSHPKKVESLRKGLDLIEAGDPIKGSKIIREVIDSLDSERLAWEEIRKNSTVFKDVTNAEINRVKEMRLAMNQDQVFSLIERLGDLVVKAVTEGVDIPRETQQRILQIVTGGIHDLVGTGSRTLLESSNNGNRKNNGNS